MTCYVKQTVGREQPLLNSVLVSGKRLSLGQHLARWSRTRLWIMLGALGVFIVMWTCRRWFLGGSEFPIERAVLFAASATVLAGLTAGSRFANFGKWFALALVGQVAA